jgi:hypothetical protein
MKNAWQAPGEESMIGEGQRLGWGGRTTDRDLGGEKELLTETWVGRKNYRPLPPNALPPATDSTSNLVQHILAVAMNTAPPSSCQSIPLLPR